LRDRNCGFGCGVELKVGSCASFDFREMEDWGGDVCEGTRGWLRRVGGSHVDSSFVRVGDGNYYLGTY
jgi:hypothetical protein